MTAQPTEKLKSTFGWLSIIVPLIGVLVPSACFFLERNDYGYGMIIIAAFTLLFSPPCFIFGLLLAITALMRGEKNRTLPTIGLLIFVAGAALFLWWLIFCPGSINHLNC